MSSLRTSLYVPFSLQKKLWETQRKLAQIDLLPSRHNISRHDFDTRDATVDLAAIVNTTSFEEVRTVRVVPNEPSIVTIANLALQKKHVVELEVNGLHWQDESNPATNEDGSTHDDLTERLFAHVRRVAPSTPGQFDKLTKLVLREVDLTLCKHTWFTFVNLYELKTPELNYCTGADIFLIHLYDVLHIPKLRSFTLVHDLGSQADRTIHAVNDLLRQTRNSLQTLILCLRSAHQLPEARLVGSKHLRILSFDISRFPAEPRDERHSLQVSQQLHYSQEDFEILVGSCENLTQLGIGFPPIDLEYRDLKKRYPEFSGRIGMLAKCPRLTVLNITNLPVGYHIYLSSGKLEVMDTSLTRLAADVFYIFSSINDRDAGSVVGKTWRCSLELLAFGARDRGTRNTTPR